MMVKKSKTRSAGSGDAYTGARIREARIAGKISQDELGKALGVSFQQVQKYEKGVNRVSVGRIQQIATKLNKPVSFFLADSGDVHSKADPSITKLLTSRDGYELASAWFAASVPARKVMLETLRLFAKEGA
jgi:transcriptional regulator with XRE-family HTH domain